jgi:hypothetical protein
MTQTDKFNIELLTMAMAKYIRDIALSTASGSTYVHAIHQEFQMEAASIFARWEASS